MTAEFFILMVVDVADGSAARNQLFTYTGHQPDATSFGVPYSPDGGTATHLVAHTAADAAFRSLLEGMPAQVPSAVYATRDGQTREVIASTIPEVQVGTSPTPREMLTAMALVPVDDTTPAPWVQPQPGVTPAYSLGDLVTHEGRIWRSEIDNNVWEPGVVGENIWSDQGAA